MIDAVRGKWHVPSLRAWTGQVDYRRRVLKQPGPAPRFGWTKSVDRYARRVPGEDIHIMNARILIVDLPPHVRMKTRFGASPIDRSSGGVASARMCALPGFVRASNKLTREYFRHRRVTTYTRTEY